MLRGTLSGAGSIVNDTFDIPSDKAFLTWGDFDRELQSRTHGSKLLIASGLRLNTRITPEKRGTVQESSPERMLSLRRWRAATMAKSSSAKRKRSPKSVLKLPDLEQSKTAVLNSLTSACSQRTYEHAIREFIDWYCSEPRLAFNKTVVTRYQIALDQKQYAPATINLRLAAVRRLAYEAADCGLLKCGPCGWDPTSERSAPSRHSYRELADRRRGKSPAWRVRKSRSSTTQKSSHGCRADRLWSPPGGSGDTEARGHPTP